MTKSTKILTLLGFVILFALTVVLAGANSLSDKGNVAFAYEESTVATVTFGGQTTEYDSFNGAWTAANAASSSDSPATIKLIKDVIATNAGMWFDGDTSGTFSINDNKNVIVDLNGKTIDRKNVALAHGIFLINAGTLTIRDTSNDESGVIKGGYTNAANTASVVEMLHYTSYAGNAVFNFESGNITGNKIFDHSVSLINVQNGSPSTNAMYTATFNMSGGKIYGNTGDTTDTVYADTELPCAVKVGALGTFSMTGGQIVDNVTAAGIIGNIRNNVGTAAKVTSLTFGGDAEVVENENGNLMYYNLPIYSYKINFNNFSGLLGISFGYSFTANAVLTSGFGTSTGRVFSDHYYYDLVKNADNEFAVIGNSNSISYNVYKNTVSFKRFDGEVLHQFENTKLLTPFSGVEDYAYTQNGVTYSNFVGWYSPDLGKVFTTEQINSGYLYKFYELAGMLDYMPTSGTRTMDFFAYYDYDTTHTIKLTAEETSVVFDNAEAIEDQTFNIKYRITQNSGVSSLKLALAFDKDLFTLTNVSVADSNEDSISDVLGFGWTITDDYSTADQVYVLLEGLNGSPTPNSTGSNSNATFITFTYSVKDFRQFYDATTSTTPFSFVTTESENYKDKLASGVKSEAFYVVDDGTGIAKQGHVKVQVDNANIHISMKGTGSLTIAADQALTYNTTNVVGKDVTFSETISNLIVRYAYNGAGYEANGNPTVTIKWYNADGTEEISAPSNAGSYQIGVAVGAGNLCSAISEVKQSFTVAKATATVTVGDETISYDDAKPTFTSQISGLLGEDSLTGSLTYATSYVKGSNVGTYSVTASGYNTHVNYNISYVAGTLTVEQATNAWTTALSNSQKEYDGNEIAHNAVAKFGTILVEFSTDNATWSATNYSDVGSYYVRVSVAETSNYTGLAWASATYRITKVVLTINEEEVNAQWIVAKITANAKTYNGENQSWAVADLNGTAALASCATVSIDENAYLNAGTHVIVVRLTATGNYSFANEATEVYSNVNATINTLAITLTAGAQTSVYNGSEPTVSQTEYTLSNAASFVASDFANNFIAIAKQAGVDAGSYTLTASVASGLAEATQQVADNYNITFVDGSFTITQAEINAPAFSSNALTYNGAKQFPTLSEDLSTYVTYGGTSEQKKDVGTYTATFVIKDKTNYKWQDTGNSSDKTLGWGIDTYAIQIVIFNKWSRFGAAIDSLTYSPGDVFEGDDLGVVLATTATTSSNVGSYSITISSYTNTNYSVTASAEGVYTIRPQLVGIPSFVGSHKTYTGSELTWAVSDFSGATTNASISSVEAAVSQDYTSANWNTSASDYNTAVRYSYNVNLQAADNYAFSDSFDGVYGEIVTTSQVSAEVFIDRATDNAWTTSVSATKANVSADIVTAGQAKYGIYSVTYYTNEACTTEAQTFAYNTTYYAKFVVTETTDYNGLSTVTSFTISGAITISEPTVYLLSNVASSTETTSYAGVEIKFTVSENDAYSLAFTAGAWKNVGAYTLTISINDGYAWSGEDTDDSIVYTLNIARAAITITADGFTVTYKDAVPTLNATTTLKEDETMQSEGLTIADYLQTNYTATSKVGDTCSVTFVENAKTSIEAVLTNYSVTLVDGAVTINKYAFDTTEFSPSFADVSKTYNSEAFTVAVTGTIPSNVSISYVCNSVAFTSKKDAGNYYVTAKFSVTGTDADCYDTTALVDMNAYLNISQLAITITPEAQTSVYTGSAPTISQGANYYTITLTAGGTVPSFVATELGTITISGALEADVNSYQLDVDTITNGNYNITYEHGTYSITQATNAWTTALWVSLNRVYNNNAISNPSDFNAVAQFGTVVFTVYEEIEGVYYPMTSMPKDAGTYYVAAAVAETNNYTGLNAPQEGNGLTLVVAPYAINVSGVTFADLTETYNSQEHAITIGGTLPVGLGTDTFTVNYSNNTRTIAGNQTATATIVVDNGSASNYTLTNATLSATLTVSKQAVTLTADNKTKEYNADVAELTYTLTSGQIYNEEIVATLSSDVEKDSDVIADGYAIVISLYLDNNNYNVTLVNGVYTVTKATNVLDGRQKLNKTTYTYQDIISVTSGTATYGSVSVQYKVVGGTYGNLASIKNANGYVNAGSYKVRFYVEDSDNYNAVEYEIDLIVGKAQLDEMEITFNGGVATWTAVTTAEIYKDVDSTVSYYVNGTQVDALTYTATEAGAISFVAKAGDNYADSTVSTNVYSVSFNDSVESHSQTQVLMTAIPTQFVFEGKKATEPTAPTITGYTFQYWDYGDGAFYFSSINVSQNYTLYAVWYIKTFAITWKDGETVLKTTNVNYMSYPSYGTSNPSKTADAEYTYSFNSWTPELVQAIENATYVVVWNKTAKTYTITYMKNTNAGVVYYSSDGTANADFGTTVGYKTLDSVAWHKIDAWYLDKARTIPAPETMPSESITVYGSYVFNIGRGDINGDGVIDTDDISIFREYIVGGYDVEVVRVYNEYSTASYRDYDSANKYFLVRVADANGDASIDIRDITTIRMAINGGYGYSIYKGLNVVGEEVTATICEVSGYTVTNETATTAVSTNDYAIAVSGNVVYTDDSVDNDTEIVVRIKAPQATNGQDYDATNAVVTFADGSSQLVSVEKLATGYVVITFKVDSSSATFATFTVDWDGNSAMFYAQTFVISTANATVVTE